MAIEAIEIRMARLEGGYEQINERLGAIEQRLTSEIGALRGDITGLRSDMTSLRSEMASRSDVTALRSEMRAADADLRKQMNAQFFWLLTFILGSILVPILRDLAR